jgi:murein endopeptidase
MGVRPRKGAQDRRRFAHLGPVRGFPDIGIVVLRRPLTIAVFAVVLAAGCGGGSRPSQERAFQQAPTHEFRFTQADGWYTTSTGLHPELPQEPTAVASTIPLAEPVLGEWPLDTLRQLPPSGIIIAVGAGPRPPYGHFSAGSLPPQLADADVRAAWEGQTNPNAPEYLILRYVNGFNLETHVYFGTENPTTEQASRAQNELNRLELPSARATKAVRVVPRVHWRRSLSLGRPDDGTLVRGVRFPAEGPKFFTWDPILHRSPDRPWRRYANDRLVRIVLRLLAEYARAHPSAPRVGIGDFSLPHGGYFGPKHVSHQNGLDVDVYYPRLDRRERPPVRAAQIDRGLAQDLLDRFVAAGAIRIFVGPNTHLRGPRSVVRILWNHDNHMHVRISGP